MMRYLSICSGIEAASVAWHPLGWRPAAFAEIDAFPSAVLAHRFPDVPNLGDITKFKDWPDADVDVLVGGTPCQSFSVAGLRKGLDDPRGNLMLTFGAIAARYRPRWLVWENVPGVLSSHGGRDFGSFLGMLGQIGYGFAYRVLDAQYVRVDGYGRAVPQRRQRVFVVGCLGDWRRAAAVLLERESLRGDPAPGRKARQDVAGTITGGAASNSPGAGYEQGRIVAGTLQCSGKAAGSATQQDAESGLLVAFGGNCTSGPIEVATACRAKGGSGHGDFESETFIAFSCKDHGADAGQVSPTLRAMGHGASHANAGGRVAVCAIQAGACRENPETGPDGVGVSDSGVAYTLEARAEVQAVQASTHVRRLTPRECERLQGFPDDWTLVPYRRGDAKDGPRYKAIGNSMAVNCMRWIGRRVALADSIKVPT